MLGIVRSWKWALACGLLTSPLAAAPATVATPATPAAPATVTPPAVVAPTQVYQRTTLPTKHAYQKTLRTHLASLTAKDFDHGVTEKFTTPPFDGDVEQQFRHYLLSLHLQPLIGTKRGAPSVNAPANLFTLAEIETPAGVMRPPVWCEPIGFLVRWNYAGNPYYQSRAMKLRAFVAMAIHVTMLDDQIETAPEVNGACRPDWLAPSLLMLSYTFPAVQDVLPEPVKEAYRTGVRKLADRIMAWGPLGEELNLELASPVALWYASQMLNDPKFSTQVEVYAKRLFTDPQFVHPAGYFIDRGGVDVGYAGETNFFATWLALTTRWPFAMEAVEKAHRLRAHLLLPEPDGKLFYGPSQFNTRYSADASRDQWEWGIFRNTAASLVTDEAIHLTKLPTAEELTTAVARRAQAFQWHINENAYKVGGGHVANDELKNSPWLFRMWQSYNFPAMVNFAYENCPPKAFAHRKELEDQKSPLLQSPFSRGETFVRDFGKAFTVTQSKTYAAIVHSGPVGDQQLEAGRTIFPGPYGFGGGQLSAFWTPETGSVILGRRGGLTREKSFDNLEEWRQWPVHAVSGIKPNGKVFTTARLREPEVKSELQADRGVVRVSGQVPRGLWSQPKALDGKLHYARTFTIEPNALTVETSIESSGQDTMAEMVETLPIFLKDASYQAKQAPTTIEVQTGGKWIAPSIDWTDKVTAVRLTRNSGAVLIEFDRARRVKLSPSDWSDTYISKATCRNVMIDLLESNDQPTVMGKTSVKYRIQAAGIQTAQR